MPPLLADFIHARVCKPKCEKMLTLPSATAPATSFLNKLAIHIFRTPFRNTNSKNIGRHPNANELGWRPFMC